LNGPNELDSKFVWYQLIHTFIKELNMKEKEVYKMNYIHSLNWLSYWYNRDKVAEAKQKNNI
jgi:hypothetical protein